MRFWQTRLHISWHIAATACGFLGGVIVAILAPAHFFETTAWLIIAALVFTCVVIRPFRYMLAIAMCAGLLAGAWRGQIELRALNNYDYYIGSAVHVTGTVAEDATIGSGGTMRLYLTNVTVNATPLMGRIWVSTSAKADIKRGDTVTFAGTLSKGFGTMPAAMYHARLINATRPQPGDIARQVRDWFADHVRKHITEPQASLGLGYLTGQKSSLAPDLEESLRLLGLTHVVVASGYNLTILVRLARQLCIRVSRFAAVSMAGMLIGSFMLVTGLSPSMSRAGLVAGLSIAAWYYGRVIHPAVLLPFAAAITVAIQPSYIWGDLGWYLSFLAFIGVMFIAPLFTSYLWGKNEPKILQRIAIETIAAQIITAPLIAYTFSQFAPLALPANIAIVPLVPLAMLLTFVTGLCAILLPAAAPILSLPAAWLLSYMTSAIHWLSQLPGNEISLQFNEVALAVSYGIIIAICLFLQRKTRHSFSKTSLVE